MGEEGIPPCSSIGSFLGGCVPPFAPAHKSVLLSPYLYCRYGSEKSTMGSFLFTWPDGNTKVTGMGYALRGGFLGT